MSEDLSAISKPGLKLNSVEKEFELSIMRQALTNMQSEMLRYLGNNYDKSMVIIVLRSAPLSEGEKIPSKDWWDSICHKIYGAVPGDVSDAMSPEEIEEVVSEKVAGAKEKTLADIESLLQRSVDEEWGKAVKIGLAANCDLSSGIPYTWLDPIAVDLSDDSERAGSKSSKTKKIASWDVEDEAISSSEFERELGAATFDGKHEGVKQATVAAEISSSVTVKLAARFGIGKQKLDYGGSLWSRTKATNNPDHVEFEFSEK